MPNHFHLLLRQKLPGGITKFMNKLGTGYSMYFNTKYDHSGVLSQGRFKSVHIDTEEYFRYIFSYVHLNPLVLVEPNWEMGIWKDKSAAQEFLQNYKYSSLYDYAAAERPERAILAYGERPDFLKTQSDLKELLRWFTGAKELAKV